ncbi:MAG: hemin uptake protein HemP [Burkholderiaceae bacterium]|nr:hemin uptake protein HemP [Rhodoferax sp.]MCP5286300.1 hemin uptake protein HemP [Burkholderiaceae bacterium]
MLIAKGSSAAPSGANGDADVGLPTASPRSALRRSTPRITSAQLLQGEPELQIQHGDGVYRLRLTALGKLILTK